MYNQFVQYSSMDSIEKYRPFKATGDDFSSSNPIFAFYFYRYFMESAIGIYKDVTDQYQKSQIQQELKQIQGKMSQIKNQLGGALQEQQNMANMLQYTQLMFAKNDHLFRQGHLSKDVAENFLTLFRLYQVVAKYGVLDQGQGKRKIYSKKKFIEIMKQVKNNPMMESKQQQPPPPPPPIIQQKIKKSAFKPLPKPSKLISYNKIQMQTEANKCLQNAISELSFDRFKFAREDVIRALELLDQLVD